MVIVHERFNSLDLFWKQPKSNFRPKICYVYVQGEYGFIPYIAGSSVEAGKGATVEIMSPNMSVDPFNRMPNHVPPNWTITQVSSNTVFLNLTNFFPIKLMPDANPDAWMKSYPAMIDVLLFLKENGCTKLNFLTSMNMSEATEESDLFVYDLKLDIRPENPLLLTMPAWAMPLIWHKMGLHACIICVQQDEGQYIDEQAYSILEEYLIASGLPYDKVHRDRLMQVLLSVRENVESVFSDFDVFDDEGGELV